MGATTPEEIDELTAAAYEVKDAEEFRALYEADAVLANSVVAYTVVGGDAIVDKIDQ